MTDSWTRAATAHANMVAATWRVGAVAEKDPLQPWSEQEVKERIWSLESRVDKQETQGVLLLAAAGVAAVGMLAIAASLWRAR